MIKLGKAVASTSLGITAAVVCVTAIAGISTEPVKAMAPSLVGAWSDPDSGSVLLISPGGAEGLIRISGQDRASHWQGECRQTGEAEWNCVAHGRMLQGNVLFTYESTLGRRTDGDAPRLRESWTGRYGEKARKGEASFRRLDGLGILGLPAAPDSAR